MKPPRLPIRVHLVTQGRRLLLRRFATEELATAYALRMAGFGLRLNVSREG